MTTAAAPWLALYDDGLPAEIEREHDSALAMFLAGVERAGDRHLLRYFDTPLTGAQVDDLSSALAVALADLGVARGDRVAVYLQNVPQFVIAFLAAWKLGAVAVSCNPMLRERELTGQLRDSGAVALVALEGLHRDTGARAAAEAGVQIAVTTSELDLLDGPPPGVLAGVERAREPGTHDLLELTRDYAGRRPPPVDLGPDDVAMLTYTSGTTGPPKGAMNTHGNVVFTSQVFRDWMRIGEDDVVLGIAPLFHITGLIAHVGLALCAPAPLVLAYRFDPAETCRLIERHRATVTVAAITAYMAIGADEGGHDLSSLVKAYSGGAPIAPATVEDLERRTGLQIRPAYGLTESTSPTHLTPLGRRAPVDPKHGALAVGIPVFNTGCRILGEDGSELPAGETGEVAVSGPQVVSGYWNKPEESANAIRDGELRTGDVGFVDESGWLYVVDRTKDMIVAAGYKVWPREVEDVLYEHPAVREAAVVGVPDPYRGETVRAFVSLRRDARVEPDELVRFCRERMAAYKYPRAVEILDELPKTASGKMLRRDLRERAREPEAGREG